MAQGGNRRQFGIRTLLAVTFVVAVFFAGYCCGFQAGRNAFFADLLESISTTVGPQTWQEIGGPGSVQPALPVTESSDESDDPFSSDADAAHQSAADPFR
jgi:hypothetical protein